MEKQEKEYQEEIMQEKDKETQENSMIKKRWFGRGIYGSKDVPIRILDGFIGGAVVLTVVLIIFFAARGGFWVTFDSQGGSEVAKQKVKHGEVVEEPTVPVRPGYVFEGWWNEKEENNWIFDAYTVENDMTLTAKWSPSIINVKFDLNGGTINGKPEAEAKEVIFGETYGVLPTPEKEGSKFSGWFYGGEKITQDTQLLMSGEHILTAEWK